MAGKPAEPEPEPTGHVSTGHVSEIERAPRADRKPDDKRFAATAERSGHDDERGAEAGERIGPVAIARYVKDDGRALIVYTRDPQAPA
jgi:hypothetical protein